MRGLDLQVAPLPTPRRHFGYGAVLLALLALVVSQLGAQWHTYRHGAAPRTEVSGRQLQAAQEPCKDCLAYAPLLAAADGEAAA